MAGKIHNDSAHHVIQFGPEPELDNIAAEPSVTLVVRQAFAFFYTLGVSPSKMVFDTKSGTYLQASGTNFNKVGPVSSFNVFRFSN